MDPEVRKKELIVEDSNGAITEQRNGSGSTVLAPYSYDTLVTQAQAQTQNGDGTTGAPIGPACGWKENIMAEHMGLP